MSRARVIVWACFLIGAVYLAKAVFRGLVFMQGDFYFSMPGEYARRLNSVLWNSPDMQTALTFNNGTYLYGPTQYLALFPVVFLNSYRSIALALLVVYPLILFAGWRVLGTTLAAGEREHRVMPAILFAMTFAFLPVTQALIQREFEVVGFLLLLSACLLLVRGNETASGVVIAALTWFKYWPVVLLGTFALHRRIKGLVAFAATSCALLLATHLVFGLQYFVLGKIVDIVIGVLRPFGTGEKLYPVIARGAQKSDFCRQWIYGRGTAADVRWALCGVEDRFPLLSAQLVFFTLIAVVGTLFVWGAVVLQRRGDDVETAKWRTIWEFSLLTIVGSAFVHAHYYYFIAFLLPLGALLWWYATRSGPSRNAKIVLWAAAYLLLNAFMLPTSWLSSLLHRDAWAFYLDSGLCLAGTLLLLSLVLWEFTHLAIRASRPLVAA